MDSMSKVRRRLINMSYYFLWVRYFMLAHCNMFLMQFVKWILYTYTHLDLSRRGLNFSCKLYFSIGINGFMFVFLGILTSLGKTRRNVNLDKALNFYRINELY